MADEQIIESRGPVDRADAADFADSLHDLAAEARANRQANPALAKTMQHVYPGAPFGRADDTDYE